MSVEYMVPQFTVENWIEIAKLVHIALNVSDGDKITDEEEQAILATGKWELDLVHNLADPFEGPIGSMVAYDGEKLIGFAQCEESGDIFQAFVHPNYRRQGVGKKLCYRLADEAKRTLGVRISVEANLLADYSDTLYRFLLKSGFALNRTTFVHSIGACEPSRTAPVNGAKPDRTG